MRLSTFLLPLLASVAVLLALAAGPARAQTAPAWASVRRLAASNPGYNYGTDIAGAPDGGLLVTGFFTGTIALGGGVTMTAGPGTGTGHLYLAKYSAAGAVQWATALDASTDLFLRSQVAVDAAGNVYLAGNFVDRLVVGTTVLTTTAPGYSSVDGFLVKFDAQGVQQWARQAVAGRAGNTSTAFLAGVAVAPNGDVLVAGDCFNSVSFGGPVVAGSGVYLCRFSPGGTRLLGQRVSDAGFLTALALDGAGNAYLTGVIFGRTAFGPVSLNPSAGSDLFLCKIDAAGTQLWAQQSGVAQNVSADCVAVDAAGTAVVGGSYANPGAQGLYAGGFTPQGTPAWARLVPTAATNSYFGVADAVADRRGGFVVTGRAAGPATFGSTTLGGAYLYGFVVRYDGRGNAVWADQPVAATANDYSGGNALAADAAGNLYVTGEAAGTVQFGALAATTGRNETYVARLTPGGVLAARPAAGPAPVLLAAYPNPASGSTTLVLPAGGGGRLVLRDALGRAVRAQALPAAAGPCPVALTGLVPGLYHAEATFANGQRAHAALQVR